MPPFRMPSSRLFGLTLATLFGLTACTLVEPPAPSPAGSETATAREDAEPDEEAGPPADAARAKDATAEESPDEAPAVSPAEDPGDEIARLRARVDELEELNRELTEERQILAEELTAARDLAARATPESPGDDGYRIRPGDVLEVLVWKNEELSRKVTVKPEGRISLPLLNEVMAAGFTPGQLRARLTRMIAEYIPSPEVSVLVEEVRSFNVSVIGEVKAPGRYDLQSRTTVLEALALAGGLTEFASRGGIRVLRRDGDEGTEPIDFDYRDAVGGDAEANFLLRPGDIIVVP